ncbi:HIT family protein [Ornithinimicrobium cryptoxanthini]|uniref:HIT family protein n=1 Tax=Ornithinimicrobium cryptoxanthini TaxID=2934161 RepID=UPI00351C2CBD
MPVLRDLERPCRGKRRRERRSRCGFPGRPVAPGHVLIVPLRHVPSLGDLEPDEGAALWTMTLVMARRVKAKHAPAVNLPSPTAQRPSRTFCTSTCTLSRGTAMTLSRSSCRHARHKG